MSSTFFGLLRLQKPVALGTGTTPEDYIPPIVRRTLAGIPQEVTAESCAEQLKRVAAEYGYAIETGFETIERYKRVGQWPRDIAELLLNPERRLFGVNTSRMMDVILPFEIHPSCTDAWKTPGAEGAHLIMNQEFRADDIWQHIQLPRFMIDVFYEEWVVEAIFAFIHLDGGTMPAPDDVLVRQVSIFQAAADMTAALCRSVTSAPDSIGAMASYILKSSYHPEVDRVLSTPDPFVIPCEGAVPPSVTKIEPMPDASIKVGDTITVSFDREIIANALRASSSPGMKLSLRVHSDGRSASITPSEYPLGGEVSLGIMTKSLQGAKMPEAYHVTYRVIAP